MPDDQIIALLTEIRDLQKQNVENYKLAMQRQQESIELQKQNAAFVQKMVAVRKKLIIMTVGAIVIVAFLLVAVSSGWFRIAR
jgi:hypothetical protein